jgi:phytoene dehydrogenase-like protein
VKPPYTVVIGAGVGGLTAAALLVKAGHRITVLEAQAYPGGCAGTFYHQGYLFDAGATLAGGFAPGGPHARVADLLALEWPVRRVDPAWVVYLDGQVVTKWAEPGRWQAERWAAFLGSEAFWRQQEDLAAVAPAVHPPLGRPGARLSARPAAGAAACLAHGRRPGARRRPAPARLP